MKTWYVLRRASCVVVLAAVSCKGRQGEPAAAVTRTTTPPPLMAPDVRLTESGGRVLDLKNERGNVVLLFFGYTHCPDVCPTTLADFAGVKRRLGARAERVKFVFISVDPKRDTPQRAKEYAQAFDHTFFGLTSDSATLAQVQRGFRTASYVEKDSTGEYSVAHSASVFIVGPDGKVSQFLRLGGSGVDQLVPMVEEALNAPVPAQVRVVDPWVRMQPDMGTPAAGYFTFDNPGTVPIVVEAVQCDGALNTTIHQTMNENGMSHMSALDSLVVPANGRAPMAPGGVHLMLSSLQHPLRVGDLVSCSIQTTAGELKIVAPVRAS